MNMDDYHTLISAIGFPIFVALYFLIYTERAMKALTKVIEILAASQADHIAEAKVHHRESKLP